MCKDLVKRSKAQLQQPFSFHSALGRDSVADLFSASMTAFLKGRLCASFVFAFMCLGDAYAGFYDEVKLRAEQGDPEAQDILSYMYQSGKGVPKDLDQARRWAALAKRGVGSGYRASPQRPQGGATSHALRSSPRRPSMNTAAYPSMRMAPRRPGGFDSRSELRASPRRPSPGMRVNVASVGVRGNEFGTIERGIRDYRRGKKWHQRMAKGGKLLVSPVTFTFKQSRRVFSKAVRKATFGSMVLY